MSQYKKRNMEEFESDMTEEFEDNSETEEFEEFGETEEFDEDSETEEFEDNSETEEFEEFGETEEFEENSETEEFEEDSETEEFEEFGETEEFNEDTSPKRVKTGTSRSVYTSSKNGSRKTSYTQYTGSRTSKGNGSIYEKNMPKKVNKAVLFKETAPYLAALILITAMAVGSFLYTKFDYQNTMDQIRQIIQGIG